MLGSVFALRIILFERSAVERKYAKHRILSHGKPILDAICKIRQRARFPENVLCVKGAAKAVDCKYATFGASKLDDVTSPQMFAIDFARSVIAGISLVWKP